MTTSDGRGRPLVAAETAAGAAASSGAEATPAETRAVAADTSAGAVPGAHEQPHPEVAADPTHDRGGHNHSDSGHNHSDSGHEHSDSGHNHSDEGHEHGAGTAGGGHGGHSHGAPGDMGRRRLAMVLGISTTLLAVEVVGAILSGSLALFADAGHMLADVGGLVLALVAAAFAQKPATATRTWGYRRAEVLAAAAQAAVLLVVGVIVLFEAVRRLISPSSVTASAMLIFGATALVGNAISVLLLQRSADESMNSRAALLEVANDALGGLAVLIAAIVISVAGWQRADPLASIVIGGLILPRTWKLLHQAINVLLEGTPEGIDLTKVRAHLLAVDHVEGVHDLHANLVATGLPVLSAHLTIDDSCFQDGHVHELLDHVQECLVGHFDVHHSTFQFEPAAHADHEDPCVEAPLAERQPKSGSAAGA